MEQVTSGYTGDIAPQHWVEINNVLRIRSTSQAKVRLGSRLFFEQIAIPFLGVLHHIVGTTGTSGCRSSWFSVPAFLLVRVLLLQDALFQ